MAPVEKKTMFVAPGKLGLRSCQGLKANFLPGFSSRTPSSSSSVEKVSSSTTINPTLNVNKLNHADLNLGKNDQATNAATMRKKIQVPNVQLMSKTNQASTVEASKEKEVNPSHSIMIIEPLDKDVFEEVHEDDFLQRSINNDAISNFLDQTASRAQINEEGEFLIFNIMISLIENPSLSQFEVVEKCFGPQDRGSVVCYGSGVKPKYVRGPLPSRADLTAIIHEKQRENDDLRKRMDTLEAERQKEREIEAKRREENDKKLEMLMTAYLRGSFGSNSDQANPSEC